MSYRIGQIHYHRGVNFGADNWLVFKKVTIDQVLSAQKKSTMFNGSLKEVEKVEDTAYNKPAQNIRIDQSAKIINKQATRHVTYEQVSRFLDEARRNCEEDAN
ncbi:hypothetical protein DICVIV_12966 [Dictyocaulus viviparus]|uniref:Uncharacterized protein n=1 Tax=Dictyocaulus viviparus TaxID=29172 RepID=A0A0D8X901_DICVI|nr:hypothetical protein DICVIV_12966 [Dictyocaulus viviparus]